MAPPPSKVVSQRILSFLYQFRDSGATVFRIPELTEIPAWTIRHRLNNAGIKPAKRTTSSKFKVRTHCYDLEEVIRAIENQ